VGVIVDVIFGSVNQKPSWEKTCFDERGRKPVLTYDGGRSTKRNAMQAENGTLSFFLSSRDILIAGNFVMISL
jgi:hypothetical protein